MAGTGSEHWPVLASLGSSQYCSASQSASVLQALPGDESGSLNCPAGTSSPTSAGSMPSPTISWVPISCPKISFPPRAMLGKRKRSLG